MGKLSPFTQKVIKVVLKIPKGKVATYGQVAHLAGKEHAARGVAWILHSNSKKYKLPWHRVINSKGTISFHPLSANHVRQKRLLKAEGVIFDHSGKINMKVYQWKVR